MLMASDPDSEIRSAASTRFGELERAHGVLTWDQLSEEYTARGYRDRLRQEVLESRGWKIHRALVHRLVDEPVG